MELPFKTTELITAWGEWMEERKERKLKKFTERGFKAAVSHLLSISGNDESTAVQIINQSIAQGWQALFPLKNTQNAINRTSNNTSIGSEKPTRFNAFSNWINEKPASGH